MGPVLAIRIESIAGVEGRLVSGVARRKETARQGVVDVENNTICTQARNELDLDGAVQRVVSPLVYRRYNPPVTLADLADLPNFHAG